MSPCNVGLEIFRYIVYFLPNFQILACFFIVFKFEDAEVSPCNVGSEIFRYIMYFPPNFQILACFFFYCFRI